MKNYQNITVDGVEYGKPRRKQSRFFNEGKWKHFIEPFLPTDCAEMTFVEFGCNYGMYLKLAKERGFATVLGIEGNEDLREITDKYLGGCGQVIYTDVDARILRNTFVADLPAADFVLMANVHYHLYVPVFQHLMTLLRHKTRYVVVVSVDKDTDTSRKLYRAENSRQAVRRYFRGWTEAGHISGISIDDDPAPRGSMYSMLFKTEVERVPIKDIPWGRQGRRFYDKVVRGMRETGDRRGQMTHPCILRPGGSLVDGNHRLAAREIEGDTTVLAEKV